jgi:nitroimidazol reductase NimA-like FMN-containing flavoprotein (pyridoxamine 5'-phosphate oxidase superfamily)
MNSKPKITPRLKQLTEKADLLRLSYLDEKGFPRVVPLWFAAVGGEYYVGTGKNSRKWKAIGRNSRAGWVIDGGEDRKYWAISAYGQAQEVTDLDQRAAAYRELGVKYFGSPDHSRFIEIYGKVDDAETVYFKLKQEGASAWEY